MELCSTIRIRGYHLDMFGHVNNARFLEFLEEARWQLLESHAGLETIAAGTFVLAVVNININYRKPVLFNHEIEVWAGIDSFSRRSAAIKQEIRFAGTQEVACDALVTFVVADPKTGTALSLDTGPARTWLETIAQ
ncbi:MAG: acyl-CoA thioesterase [Myxococcota bacterium]|jgi:thioesterase-3|nr:acyl-CoA thioesterase [Myxococcota bacterium]